VEVSGQPDAPAALLLRKDFLCPSHTRGRVGFTAHLDVVAERKICLMKAVFIMLDNTI
jgi:hypothetical protein